MSVGGQRHAPAALHPGKRQNTQCTRGWIGSQAVWTATENLVPTGIRFPDRRGRSESLYGLCYHRQNFTLTFTYRYFGFPYWYHSINPQYSFTHLPPTLDSLGN